MPLLHQQQPAFLGEGEGTVGNRAELAAIGVCQGAEAPGTVCGQEATVVFDAITGIGLTDPPAEVLLAERQQRRRRSEEFRAESVHR
jgi:hypothetical protein